MLGTKIGAQNTSAERISISTKVARPELAWAPLPVGAFICLRQAISEEATGEPDRPGLDTATPSKLLKCGVSASSLAKQN